MLDICSTKVLTHIQLDVRMKLTQGLKGIGFSTLHSSRIFIVSNHTLFHIITTPMEIHRRLGYAKCCVHTKLTSGSCATVHTTIHIFYHKIRFLHVIARRDEVLLPSGCCNPRASCRPPTAFQQKSIAAGPVVYPPCPEFSVSHSQ